MNRNLRFYKLVRTRREERGQALVELALTMPLLLLLLLGAVEFGRLAYMSIELANAAKAVAQYGAQDEAHAANLSLNSQAAQLVAEQEAPYTYNNCTNFTTSIAYPPNTYCVCVSNGAVSAPSSAACSGTCTYTAEVLQIKTSASCNPIIHAPGFPGSFTLQGNAVQEVLN